MNTTRTIPDVPEQIIIRYLQGTATREEKQLLDEWLRDGQNLEMFCQFVAIWDSGKTLSEREIDRRRDRLFRKIAVGTVAPGRPKESGTPRKRIRMVQMLRYAAAVLVGAVLTSMLWFGSQRRDAGVSVQNVVYNNGGVQKVVLPDSSTVWLSGNSRMSYPERFDDLSRQVALEGEAFFEVRKAPSQPFEVQAGNVDVQVTGTEFVVRNVPEADITVTLVSGSVTVSARNGLHLAQLAPGQQASIDGTNGRIAVTETDTYYYVAWKDGSYRFRDEPLQRVADMLARRYGVNIHVAGRLKDKRFTGRVMPEHRIDDVMKIIHAGYPVAYRITKTDVYITEK